MNANSGTDKEKLIKRAQTGEESAQKELYEMLFRELFPVAMRYMKGRDTARDMMQETFVKVFTGMDKKYNSTGSFVGWVRRILVNCCIDELRKSKPDFSNFESEYEHPEAYNDDEILRNKKLFQDAEFVMEEVNNLPDTMRIIFSMYAIEGYKHKEIAEMLDMPVGSCKSAYKRAKDQLKVKLKSKVLDEQRSI